METGDYIRESILNPIRKSGRAFLTYEKDKDDRGRLIVPDEEKDISRFEQRLRVIKKDMMTRVRCCRGMFRQLCESEDGSTPASNWNVPYRND